MSVRRPKAIRPLSPEQIDREAMIDDNRVDEAAASWRERMPERFSALLDAQLETEQDES